MELAIILAQAAAFVSAFVTTVSILLWIVLYPKELFEVLFRAHTWERGYQITAWVYITFCVVSWFFLCNLF